nr:hypothetical protein [Tanacetum cinerariifolium]
MSNPHQELASPDQTVSGQTATGKEILNPFMAVAIKKVNDVIRLQALVDKKKVVVTEDTIREALYLDDAEGVKCLPSEEIFAELARMGYEKASTKLTFYKTFFSSQLKFLIHTILQCMSAKRTSWNEFSSSRASAVICLSSGRKFNFSKYIFDSLVRNVDSPSKFYMYPRFLQLMIRKQVGDLSTHTTKYTSPALTQKVFTNMRRVGKGFSRVETPLFEGMLVEQVIEEEDDDEHVEDVTTGFQHLVVVEVEVEVIVVEPEEDESEPAEVLEVVDVVTTAKIITEVVTAASTTITDAKAQVPAATLTAAPPRVTVAPSRRRNRVVIRDPQEESTTSTIIHAETKSNDKGKGILLEEPKPLKKQQQIKQNEKYARELEAELNKNIDWDEVNDHVKMKAKEDPAVKKYQALKRKPQTESQARKNIMLYLNNKTKEQIKEEESRALKRKNETPTEKAAKREDLEALWSLVKERFFTAKPKNFFDDFLLMTLGAMFEKPDIHTQIWKNQRSVHGLAKVKNRKYPLTRFTLDQMLNAVRLEVKEDSEVSLELLSFGVDAAKELKKNTLSV